MVKEKCGFNGAEKFRGGWSRIMFHEQKNREAFRHLALEILEEKRVLGWGDIFGSVVDFGKSLINDTKSYVTSGYNEFKDHVVAPVVNTTKVVATEVKEHFVEPVVQKAHKTEKEVSRVADVAIDQVSHTLDKGLEIATDFVSGSVQAGKDLLKAGEGVANNVVYVVSEATKAGESIGGAGEKILDSLPGTSLLSVRTDVAAGMYSGAKELVTGTATVLGDVYSLTLGRAVDGERAKEVGDKYVTVGKTIYDNPSVLVTAVVDSYAKEKDPGRIIGKVGFDVASIFVGAGEVSSALKGAKTTEIVSAATKVAKSGEAVAEVSSAAKKATQIVEKIDTRGIRTIVEVPISTKSSYTNKAIKTISNDAEEMVKLQKKAATPTIQGKPLSSVHYSNDYGVHADLGKVPNKVHIPFEGQTTLQTFRIGGTPGPANDKLLASMGGTLKNAVKEAKKVVPSNVVSAQPSAKNVVTKAAGKVAGRK